MPLPSDQDYNEAVQNPKTAFEDVELQSGLVEYSAMGIPKPRSGNFAVVYKVIANGSPYAVKCFKYDNPECSRRYPAIASHLSQNTLPYFVRFRYMSHGIRVGGSWYPILKMKWIEGDSLIVFIEKNLSNPGAMQSLAASWVRLLSDLHEAKIAHGDLQHGNVLVVGGQLKLVDYDGMYVPALDGSLPLEKGHSNYQHPERTDFDFGLYLDNFSAWLIYVSLLALSVRPALWQQLRSGDDCLLFRKTDLDSPDRSEAFRLLRSVPDERIRNVIDQIEDFLLLPLAKIPSVIEHVSRSPLAHSPSQSTGLADWIKDGIRASDPRSPVVPPSDSMVGEIGDPSWILDHAAPEVQIGSFTNSVTDDRLLALTSFVLAAVASASLSVGTGLVTATLFWLAGLAIATGATVILLRIRYQHESVSANIRLTAAALQDADRNVGTAKTKHEELRRRRQQRRDLYLADRSKVQTKQATAQADEAKELNRLDAELQKSLQHILESRRSLAAEEAKEKRKLADTIAAVSNQINVLSGQQQQEQGQLDLTVGNKVRGLDIQLRQAIARRDSDLSQALKEYQDQIVNSHLQRHRISNALIPGIGTELKHRLAQAGYMSAGDIGTRHVNVPGIGQKKWDALNLWRAHLDNDIRWREAPKALPTFREAAIEQRYESQIRQLEQSLSHDQSQYTSASERISKRYSDQKRLLEQKRASEEISVRQELAIVERRFEQQRNLLSTQEANSRVQFERGAGECKRKSNAAIADLQSEAERLQVGFTSDVEEINKELTASAKLVSEISWRRDHASQAHAAYAPLTFRRYSLRVIGRS